MPQRIAIVTDSTSSLTPEIAKDHNIVVVPLQVIVDDDVYTEGVDISAEGLADALRAGHKVSTSMPSPEAFGRAYAAAHAAGADQIVSVHLSAEVSGTFESSQVAARSAPLQVHCVDARQVALGTGFAAITAAEIVEHGGSAEQAVAGAKERGQRTSTYFYVDTLEYLRRGGRVTTLSALVGSALAVKPLLSVTDGLIGPFEKVRTSSRALHRLQELAVAAVREAEAAGHSDVDIAVQHLVALDRASTVAERLERSLGVDDIQVHDVGSVIGAHVGPGMVGVVVSPRV